MDDIAKDAGLSAHDPKLSKLGFTRRMALLLAGHTPSFFKRWVHSHRFFDNLSRKTFARAVRAGNSAIRVESGPLAGTLLAPSEHISHAHIKGIYELETLKAIDACVQQGFVCYDLGASIGYMSLLMARKASQVFAFEPSPHAAREARRNADVNGFANVEVLELPISDREREVSFAVTDVAYGSGIVDAPSRWPTLELTATTLDIFVKSHPFPDFIKVDVENEEGRVLAGARSILQERRSIICCELHSKQSADRVLQILSECCYRMTNLAGEPFQMTGPIVPGETQVLAFPN